MIATKKKADLLLLGIHFLLFLMLVYFFSIVTPLIIYDLDDWVYLGQVRIPVPIWRGWNPARVFCESFMPIGGRIAAWFIYPITKDYVFSVTIASAICISIFIIIMCRLFFGVMYRRLKGSVDRALITEGIFLVSFFLMFRNRATSNYLFHAADLCTVYFYVMSGILNACVVLYMMQYKDFTAEMKTASIKRNIVFFIALYFAMFSNLFHSAITVVYCLGAVIYDFFRRKLKAKDLLLFVKSNSYFFLVLIMWIIAVAFEKSGGRSGEFAGFDIEIAIMQFIALIKAISVQYWIIVLFSILLCVINIAKKKASIDLTIISMMSLLFITVFLLVLNAVVKYMSRLEASWGIWFYVITICSVAIGGFSFRDNKNDLVALGVVLMTMIFFSYMPNGKYLISSDRNTDYDFCYKTSSYFADELINADKEGLSSIALIIPKPKSDNEFTFVKGIGNSISRTLYFQGIISKQISVTETVDDDRFDELIK